MSKRRAVDQFDLAGRLVGYATSTRYRVRGDFLFAGIPLAGAHLLEVGCGTGAWGIWAALHGAHRVIGIEPEATGSSPGTLATFQQIVATLGLGEQIEATEHSLQEFPIPERPFDVVIMYNVINHLDEEAVVVLHRDAEAFARYVSILQNLRLLMRSDGWVVVADCMRDNFWPRLGLHSPFAPGIEWSKHQSPHTWIDIFEHAGFQSFDLRWSPLQPFPKLTANRFVQWLTCSHFVLRLRAR
jgi:Predicted RNA methylase